MHVLWYLCESRANRFVMRRGNDFDHDDQIITLHRKDRVGRAEGMARERDVKIV